MKSGIDPCVDYVFKKLYVLAMFTKDENEREIYELRLKFQRDHDSLAHGLKDAEEHGFKKGELKGELKGLMGQIHLCQRLLKQPPTPREELSALPIEKLTGLLDQLQKQLLPNGDGHPPAE